MAGWSRLVQKARRQYDGSLLQEVLRLLTELDFMNTIVLFGGAFLFSVLPLIILLSSFANARVDTGVTHHLTLNNQAAHIVQDLFTTKAGHPVEAIVLALLVSVAGTLTVASCVQTSYEKIFGQDHQRHGGTIRLLVWIVVLGAWLTYDAVVVGHTHHLPAGVVVAPVAIFVGAFFFFWFSMHFLLTHAVSWRVLRIPALSSAIFWIGLDVFDKIYFSSSIVTDSRLYGKVGVVFDLLTWFVAIAAVVILGPLTGAVWQNRRARSSSGPREQAVPSTG